MKMFEILELQSLYNSILNVKLPIKTAYKFARLMKRAESEIEFYQTKFQEIIAEYGEKDENGQYKLTEDGQSIVISTGKERECNRKIMELRDLDVEIGNISFTFDEMEKLEGLNVSISELACIMSLIED